MTEIQLDDYIKAGKGVIAAKKLAKRIIKPGVPLLEIAEKCEAEIIKNGCELAFPTNLSLNEFAAHYSPPIDDISTVPERGLLKIDIGAHVNGYIADSAFTININGDNQLQTYIYAAKEALNAAIELFKPGIKLYELGEVIDQKIRNRRLIPITNLGGHELKQNDLHAGPFIPNHKDTQHDQILQPGDAYACEPFATSGVGLVKSGNQSYIYRFAKRVKKNISMEERVYMNKIEKNFGRLPFSPRWIANKELIPKSKIEPIIKTFLRKNIIDNYPLLIERRGAPVAQEEHTIVLDMEGNRIVTTRE